MIKSKASIIDIQTQIHGAIALLVKICIAVAKLTTIYAFKQKSADSCIIMHITVDLFENCSLIFTAKLL